MATPWPKLQAALKDRAPAIAGLLGGPFSAVGLSAVSTVLGLGLGGDDTTLAGAVGTATTDQLAALARADADLAAQVQDLAGSTPVVSPARVPERELAVIASVIIGSFIFIMCLMAFVPVPVANQQALSIMTGTASAAFAGIVSYYFGSSRGSQAKTAMLWQSTPTQPPTPPVKP